MAICKFYAQGNCRFGDRCWNEHQDRGQETYNYNSRQQSPERYNQRQQSPERYNQRQQSPERYNERYYSPERYNERRNVPERYDQYNAPGRYEERHNYSGSTNQQHNAPATYQGQYAPQQYNSYQGYNSQGKPFGNQQSGQNPYSWVSSNYQRPAEYLHQPSKYDDATYSKSYSNRARSTSPTNDLHQPSKYHDARYSTSSSQKMQSTGPSSSNFYKEPIAKTTKNYFDVLNNLEDSKENIADNNVHLEIIKEDAIAWKKGNQWPFSCYFPFKGHPQFPDLVDLSPEELRYQAYEAQKRNEFPTYISSVSEAMDASNKTCDLLINPTQEVIAIVKRITKEKLTFEDVKVRKKLFFDDEIGTAFQAPTQLFGKPVSTFGSSSSNFNLNHLAENRTDANDTISMNAESTPFTNSSSSSSFKFVLPTETIGKQLPASSKNVVSSGSKSSTYTPLEELTQREKELFSSATFTSGQIPTRPPPQVLCF